MKLSSRDVGAGGSLDRRHGKKFDNVSPQLSWSDVPADAAALALTMVDVHPVARGYVHWVIVDLPAQDADLPGGSGGALPVGRELTPYAGPFPPSGTHEYVFTLYALDDSVAPLGPRATHADLLAAVDGHTLQVAELRATFTKPSA